MIQPTPDTQEILAKELENLMQRIYNLGYNQSRNDVDQMTRVIEKCEELNAQLKKTRTETEWMSSIIEDFVKVYRGMYLTQRNVKPTEQCINENFGRVYYKIEKCRRHKIIAKHEDIEAYKKALSGLVSCIEDSRDAITCDPNTTMQKACSIIAKSGQFSDARALLRNDIHRARRVNFEQWYRTEISPVAHFELTVDNEYSNQKVNTYWQAYLLKEEENA